MQGGEEDLRGIFDAHRFVDGTVKDQQGLFHAVDGLFQLLAFDIVDELLLDAEGPPAQMHLGLTLGLNLFDILLEILRHMGRVAGSTDCRHAQRFRNSSRHRQHGGTAKTVPDKDLRRFMVLPQVFSGDQEVFNVGREVGIGEFSVAAAKACKIKA